MNSSGPAHSSPVKGHTSQYIPSLFATNAHAAISDSSSSDAGGGGHAAMDRYARAQAARQNSPVGGTATATSGRPLPAHPVGHGLPHPPRTELGFAGGTNPASPSPASTIDYDEIQQKQVELRSAVEYRIQSLESTLAVRDEEIVRLRAELRKMEEDYQFNYQLIGERDAALEEAAQQLQRLYREMKRVTHEGGVLEKRLQAAEAELAEARRRVRDTEAAGEAAVLRTKREYAIKEQHLAETAKAREAALEAEQQRVHQDYMKQVRLLEETKTEVEGRTATVSTQLEERHRQVVQRLEAEVERLHTRLHTVESEKTAAEKLVEQLREQHCTLQQQCNVAVQRQRATAEEAAEAKQRLEAQLAETTGLLNKSLSTAEDAIREEVQKSSRLELDNTSLQSRLAEAKAQLQEAHNKQLADSKAFAEERRVLSANYEAAVSTMEEAERRWRDGERSLQSALTEKTEEAVRLARQLQEAQRGQLAAEASLEANKNITSRLQRDVERLTSEVQQWKEEEAKTAAAARRELSAAEEKILALERVAQEGKDEVERQRRKLVDQQQRSQAEAARLTRELHASEAARRALEDQFHLAQDRNGQAALIAGLRYEKEALEKRVMELERTNGEIREQVANFTLELQNDPAVRAARETQRKVQELQHELLTARDETQRLRDTLAEKNEELARYQVDILRAQMLLGSGGIADHTSANGGLDAFASALNGTGAATNANRRSPTLSTSAAAVLRRQQEQMREEWAAMRERLMKEVRKKQKEGIVRHRRRTNSTSSSSSTSSTTSSSLASSHDSSSCSSSRPYRKRCSDRTNRRRGGKTRRHAARATVMDLSVSPVVPGAAAATNHGAAASADDGVAVKNSYLLQEAEVWRQKSLQLEQHLHVVIRERDQLRRELTTAKQDISSLSSEKQSLLDLNSLLKAQLREAYRTSYESFSQATASAAARAGTGGSQSTTPVTPAGTNSAPMPPPEWVAAAAAVIAEQQLQHQQLQHQQRQREHSELSSPQLHTKPPRHPVASTPSGASRESKSSAARPEGRAASSYRHGHAGLNTSAFSNSNSTAEGGSPSAAHVQQQQRLMELEEEIKSVRGQIASTMKKQQQRSASTSVSSRKEQSSTSAVYCKGGSAVRHYGYQ